PRGRVHALLPRLLRPVPVARAAGDAGRARPPAALVPDQHLRPLLLGSRDRGADDGADGAPAAGRTRSRLRPARTLGGAAGRLGPRLPTEPARLHLAELLPRPRQDAAAP